MINFFAGLFALAFGFGMALWICGNMLNKSNNIGDSRGDGAAYKAETTFTSRCNRMDRSASRVYVQQNVIKADGANGPAGQEKVRRLTEEERRKKAREEKKARVPKGAFVSKNTSAASDRYEIPAWEKRAERDDLM